MENLWPILTAGLIGLIAGSFLSMLTWRLPRRMLAEAEGEAGPPLWDWHTRSQCPHCQHALPWWRLIPLVSWLASRGRCHACHHPISWRYPLIELAAALLAMLAIWHFGPTPTGLLAVLFGWGVLAIMVIDWEHKLIPDSLSLPLLWLGLLASTMALPVTPEEAIWGAALGYGLLWSVYWGFRLLTGREGMGYGDFKMMAAMGAWLGVSAIPFLLLTSALTAIIVQLMLRMLGRGETAFAFGPYIGLAGLAGLYFYPVLEKFPGMA